MDSSLPDVDEEEEEEEEDADGGILLLAPMEVKGVGMDVTSRSPSLNSLEDDEGREDDTLASVLGDEINADAPAKAEDANLG